MAGEQTTTRGELRSRLSQLLGDRFKLTATVNGTATEFRDKIRMSSGIINPKNREIVFTSGTNSGLSRRITDCDVTSGNITFEALTASTALGDTAEMYNNNGKGWNKDDYDTCLQMAQDDAYPGFKVPTSAVVALAFDMDSPIALVPAAVTSISKVEYVDTNGDYIHVPRANGFGYGWELDPTAGNLTFRGASLLAAMDGLSITVTGGSREASFTTDASTTGIDPLWLVFQAAGHCCMQAYHRGDTSKYNTALYFYDKADRIIPVSRTTSVAVRTL